MWQELRELQVEKKDLQDFAAFSPSSLAYAADICRTSWL